MQLADLALGEREQPHPGETQPLQQAGNILLVARQPVERLGDDDVKLAAAGILKLRLIGRAQRAGAADRPVGIGMAIFPALPLDPLTTEPDLVLDRGIALQVRAVAGVDDGPQFVLLRQDHRR